MPNKLVVAFVSVFLVLAAVLAAYFIPFSHSEGDVALNVLDCLRSGHVTSTFLPGFYPFLCALLYKPFGPSGVVALQCAMYLGLGALTFATILRVSANTRGAALATALILLDPDLLSSIPKLWDTLTTVLLLSALLFLSCVALRHSKWVPPLLGIVWGLGLAVRPNLAVMAAPIGYALWLGYGKAAWLRGALVAALAVLTLAAANTSAHGGFYLPQNGPYNLFAGANPHTQFALIHDYNAEPSIPPAMAGHGYPAVDFHSLSLVPVYTRFALAFMSAHPFEWLWLALVKLATLLRPDTKVHALWTGAGLIKLLTSLSTPLWLVLLAFTRPLRQIDKLILVYAAAYVLPFLITNADPRFRPALDVLVLTHAAILVIRKMADHKAEPLTDAARNTPSSNAPDTYDPGKTNKSSGTLRSPRNPQAYSSASTAIAVPAVSAQRSPAYLPRGSDNRPGRPSHRRFSVKYRPRDPGSGLHWC